MHTDRELARIANVSHDTIAKVEVIVPDQLGDGVVEAVERGEPASTSHAMDCRTLTLDDRLTTVIDPLQPVRDSLQEFVFIGFFAMWPSWRYGNGGGSRGKGFEPLCAATKTFITLGDRLQRWTS